MALLRDLSIIALMTLVIYFALQMMMAPSNPIYKAAGSVSPSSPTASTPSTPSPLTPYQDTHIAVNDNMVPLGSLLPIPAPGSLMDTQGSRGAYGGSHSNERSSAIYDPNVTGVLPSNQEIREERNASFGSEYTNLNLFYQQNPEIFRKTNVYVPNAADWEMDSKQLETQMKQTGGGEGIIMGYNYERNFTKLS